MKKILVAAIMLLCLFAYAQHPDVFESLTALTGGSWQMKTAKGIIAERWKKAGDTKLQSVGFKIVGKDTTILEKVDLIKKDDGIYYVPTVKDQNGEKPVYFKLISSANKEFIFTNPAHDFPQRVVYHIISADSVHAYVDGQYHGKFVKQDFYYKRIAN